MLVGINTVQAQVYPSSLNLSYQREFDPSNLTIELGSPLRVTVSLVNNESTTYRGVYFTEQIHNNFSVQTIGVKINGIDVLNYQTSTGSVGDVYNNHIPYYWLLETPPNYPENNPIQSGDSLTIIYQLIGTQSGSYNFNKDGILGIDGSGTDNSFFALDDESMIIIVTDNSTNDPPVAFDDFANTNEDIPVVIDVLANDSDPDGNLVPSSVSVTGGPSNGGTSVNVTTGAVTYTPDLGFVGADIFTYTVEDDSGAASNTATVTVTVNLVNDPPVAFDDFANTNENIPVVIDVLTNDSDPDGNLVPSSVTVTGGPSNGGTSVNVTTGAVTYTPDLGFVGVDIFTYTVEDDSGAVSNTATVTVTVNVVNDPPVAFDDFANTNEDIPVVIDVLTNDSDPDGNLVPSSVTVTGGPSNGGTSVNVTTGEVTYSPNAEYNGTDIFTYTVEDDSGAISNTATVTVTIRSINDPPVLVNIPDIDFDEDGNYILPLNPYVTDVDHNLTEISFTSEIISATRLINLPDNYYNTLENQLKIRNNPRSTWEVFKIGTNDLNISIDPITNIATFSSTADSSGQFTVVFTAIDDSSAADTDTITVIVNSINDSPASFGLLLPIDGDTISSISDPINFIWNMSNDADNDSLFYGLNIFGAGKDTTIEGILDTSFTFIKPNFWQWDYTYNWTCDVNDGQISITSIDTFSIVFYRPPNPQAPTAPRNLRLRR